MPRIEANGIGIHYEERGQGDPLLLIMGLGADGSLWEDHVAAWEGRYRCLLMDNRGAGRSDKPAGPYTTRMMAEDAAGLMAALGIERAHVAGISMGGAIAQELALAHPGLVRSLALISTWPRCNAYAATAFRMLEKMRAVASPADFAQLLQLWIYAPPFYENTANRDELRQAQVDAAEEPMPLHAFAAQCAACITHDALERLAEIAAPTLITVGERDIFTPPAFAQAIHERVPDSELVTFPGCGHVHHWEDLERFNRTVLGFLGGH